MLIVGCGSEDEGGKYTLNVTTIGAGSVNISPLKETYEPNEKVTLKAIPEENWRFTYWEGSMDNTSSEITVVMDGNITLKSVFGATISVDRFTNNEDPNEWGESSEAGRYNIEIKDEKYLFTIENKDSCPLKSTKGFSNDIYFEAEAEFVEKNESSYGFIFNFKDWENFYLLHIDSMGYYKIDDVTDGEFYEILEWKKSDLINTYNNNKNKIAFKRIGSTFTFYVNNQYLDEITLDDNNNEFTFGLGVYTWETPVTVAFDNITGVALVGEKTNNLIDINSNFKDVNKTYTKEK